VTGFDPSIGIRAILFTKGLNHLKRNIHQNGSAIEDVIKKSPYLMAKSMSFGVLQ
jgi:hypothetical protein